MTTDPLLSIAEASRALGVSERTLRRLLHEPGMAAKTVAQYRQTRTGMRRSVLLPDGLIQELFKRVSATDNNGRNTGRTPADVVSIYERLLTEKNERIAELRIALAQERERSRQLEEALMKAQESMAQLTGETSGRRKPFWHRFTERVTDTRKSANG